MKLEIQRPSEAAETFKAVALCVATTSKARPILNTLRLRPCEEGVEVTGCDSYILATDVVVGATHDAADWAEVLIGADHVKAIVKVLADKSLRVAILDITPETVTLTAGATVSTFPTYTDGEYPDIDSIREAQQKDHAEAAGTATEVALGGPQLGAFTTMAKLHRTSLVLDMPSTALKPVGVRLSGRSTFSGLVMPVRV